MLEEPLGAVQAKQLAATILADRRPIRVTDHAKKELQKEVQKAVAKREAELEAEATAKAAKAAASAKAAAEAAAKTAIETAKALVEAKLASKREDLLATLTLRQLTYKNTDKKKIETCNDLATLTVWFSNAITASTIQEVFQGKAPTAPAPTSKAKKPKK